MGIDSNFWGPHLWIFLHSVAASYSDNPTFSDIKEMEDFVRNLAKIIPCSICKKHFMSLINDGHKSTIRPFGITILKNRKSFFKWTYDIHNYVNKYKKLRPGQIRHRPPSYKSVILYYNTKLSIKTKQMKLL